MHDAACRVEICGGIASGKTTLATALHDIMDSMVLEEFASNPFYTKFYGEPERYAFETEITFLLMHYSAARNKIRRHQRAVLDYSLLQDLAYAEVNLNATQIQTFRTVYNHVRSEIGQPTVLIHLACDPSEELRRIRQRHRDSETSLSISYLHRLNEAIKRNVARVSGRVSVLSIDSAGRDYAHNPRVRETVACEIADFIGV